MNGAQPRAARPWRGIRFRHDVCRPVKPETIAKSLATGYIPPTALRADLAADRRLGGCRQRRGIRAGHCAAGPDHRHLHRDGGGSEHYRVAKLAARGDIGPDERVVW